MDANVRSLTEKQARIKTLSYVMSNLNDLIRWRVGNMDTFSTEETNIFGDAIDQLDHFVRLATANT